METNQDAEIWNSSVFDYGQCTKEVKTQEVYENLLEVATAAICKASRGSQIVREIVRRDRVPEFEQIYIDGKVVAVLYTMRFELYQRDVDSSPLHRVDALAFHGLQKNLGIS